MLQEGDRLVMLRALKRYVQTLLRSDYVEYQPKYEEWIEAQAAYRVAEALANPKRGFRAHTVKGYAFYYDANRTVPVQDIEGWIQTAKKAVTG